LAFGAFRLAGNGGNFRLPHLSKQTNEVLSRMSEQEWQHLIAEDHASRRQVAWKIKITAVSSFGGFYAKGHLLHSNGVRVHLIWPPEKTPSGTDRNILTEGGDVTIRGNIQGVTTEKEVIISVNEYSRQ